MTFRFIRSDGDLLWWKWSRCDHSARVQRAVLGVTVLLNFLECPLRHNSSQRDEVHQCWLSSLASKGRVQRSERFVEPALDELQRGRVFNFASQNVRDVERVHGRALLRQNLGQGNVHLQFGKNLGDRVKHPDAILRFDLDDRP